MCEQFAQGRYLEVEWPGIEKRIMDGNGDKLKEERRQNTR